MMVDFSTKAGVIAALKAECDTQGLPLPEQKAYVIATTDWETSHTFQPVREAFYISRDPEVAERWRRDHLKRYYPYYGRGYTQLTWLDNYQKYTLLLRKRFPGEEIDLVKNPDQAMVPKYALFIIVHGFKHGTFTGKKLEDFVDESGYDFYNARTCINGHDKADTIAALAEKYLEEEDYG